MANAVRGQVSLKAGDTIYTLCLSANAMCSLEEHTGRDIGAIAASLNGDGVSMLTVRSLVWAALQDHHPEIDIKGAGHIITEAGMSACMEAIGAAFQRAFPDAEVKDDPNPPKAKAG